jgi:hypothetical protein
MTTYTLAYSPSANVLWALAPDGDVKGLESQLAVYRDQIEMFDDKEGDDLKIETGLTLTDDLEPGDDLIWTGGATAGDLSVKPGEHYAYAVRR